MNIYIWGDLDIGTVQGITRFCEDNYLDSWVEMKNLLRPTKGDSFHDKPQIVDLEGRLPQ